jgi:acyl-CoA hydrolase
MPRTYGKHTVHLSETAGWSETDTPLIEPPAPTITDIDRAIAGFVAERIPDGAVLQFGIGAVPDAVAGMLADRKDLGVHTELFSDGLRRLVESGAVTGARKRFERGKIVTTTILGSRSLYDFVDDNPEIELLPVHLTNSPLSIARHPGFVAVNATMQVDLMGQCASESLGLHYVSSSGGQADYMYGATLSEGGQNFIVAHATAHRDDGQVVSRIVPALAPGAVVTTHKNVIDKVVTEFGVAELRGATTQERARQLIAIAHPDFRDGLEREARADGILH